LCASAELSRNKVRFVLFPATCTSFVNNHLYLLLQTTSASVSTMARELEARAARLAAGLTMNAAAASGSDAKRWTALLQQAQETVATVHRLVPPETAPPVPVPTASAETAGAGFSRGRASDDSVRGGWRSEVVVVLPCETPVCYVCPCRCHCAGDSEPWTASHAIIATTGSHEVPCRCLVWRDVLVLCPCACNSSTVSCPVARSVCAVQRSPTRGLGRPGHRLSSRGSLWTRDGTGTPPLCRAS
jgi:hypothetical protein